MPSNFRLSQTLWCGLALLAGLSLSTACLAVPIQVDSAADNLLDGDGQCTLREAIDNANWGTDFTSGDCESGGSGMDTIQIQAGLPTIVLNGTELQLRKTMAIIGPEAGQEISGNTLSRVFYLSADLDSGGTKDYRLDNLRIVDGLVSSPSGSCGNRGAGLCMDHGFVNVQSRVFLRDIVFRDNQAQGLNNRAGGAYFGGNVIEVDIQGALFDGNKALGFDGSGGGAYFADVDRVRLSNVRFVGNRATGPAGALFVTGAQSFSLSAANLSNNQGIDNQPSAMAIVNTSQAYIQNTRVVANLNVDGAQNLTHEGYAIRVTGDVGDVASLSNVWIDQNLGCGLGIVGVPTFISGSTISRNNCNHNGVALRVTGADVEATASSFLDNTSPFAAISLDGGKLTLESSTVVGNQATTVNEAGGVRLDAGTLTLRNTILADNISALEGSFERVGGTVNAAYSQFSDASAEINGSSSNNLFQGGTNVGAFGDYGCATKAGDTFVGPPVCVSLRPLSSNSPALDVGNAYGSAYDQRGVGFARTEGAATDIGAYEYQAPQISIEAVDASKDEGNSGQTIFQFRVRRNGDTRADSYAAWNIQGSGAHPADSGDFPATTWIGGSAYFAAGQTEATINIYVWGDTTAEDNERFQLALAALTNGTMGSPSTAVGEIINDDAFFPSAVLSLTRLEGDLPEGQSIGWAHRFRVTRSQVTTGYCSFQLQVLSASGPFATDAADFVGWTPGVAATYVMSPGNTQWDIDVQVAPDHALEFDESFELRVQNASGCAVNVNANQASSTIINDDSSLWIEAITSAAPEGNAGSTAFSFRMRRGSSDVNPASMQYAVTGTGAAPASAGDFTGGAFPTGTASFAVGQEEVLVVVNVAGDGVAEPNEGFRVTLSNPSGGEIYPTDHVDATIQNDDSAAINIFTDSFE